MTRPGRLWGWIGTATGRAAVLPDPSVALPLARNRTVVHDCRRPPTTWRRTTEATPTRPEDERENEADDSRDYQDYADRVNVQPRDCRVHGPGQNCASSYQEKAYACSHDEPPVKRNPLPRGAIGTAQTRNPLSCFR